MELYTLDGLLRRQNVVDKYKSLIWTERFNEFGDFELAIQSDASARRTLLPGVMVSMNKSYRVMTIETVEDTVDSDGNKLLKVKGNSIEAYMVDRIAKSSLAATTPWAFTLAPAAAMRKLFHDICVTGSLSVYDIIPGVVEAMHPSMPTNTIAEPLDPQPYSIEAKPLYDAMTEIAKTWTLGFRLLRSGDNPTLYWDVYAGSNRTSGQSTRAPVIFSPDLDNLTNTTELNSIESSKNVAYVFAPNGARIVYPLDVAPSTAGFDRRVLMVDANDITLAAGSALDAALDQRGLNELSQNRSFQAFDGEINQTSQYLYERDYYLGDLVEIRNVDGVMNQMRVTEQIFVHDEQGERSYPTLAKNQFINTGSWLSWLNNKSWADLDPDPTTWSEQP